MKLLSPFKWKKFRVLWAGMGLSYAGDRLQELAQGGLVAVLTESALAVGALSILTSVRMGAWIKRVGKYTIFIADCIFLQSLNAPVLSQKL
jgi:hypothetical protein